LGHLLRCLYLRRGKAAGVGTCKATWLAAVFGISDRNAKAARQHLIAIGFLKPVQRPQWHLNRFGRAVQVNLAWSRESEHSGSAPPAGLSPSESSPLDSEKKLLTEYKNQNPAFRGPTGVCNGAGKEPNLRHIVPEDLRSLNRLLKLFAQAVSAGFVTGGEHERLQFVAAAIHAKSVGTRNPCGLFAFLVRKRLWSFITQDDEELARRKLRDHEFGARRRRTPSGEAFPIGGVVQSVLQRCSAQAGGEKQLGNLRRCQVVCSS